MLSNTQVKSMTRIGLLMAMLILPAGCLNSDPLIPGGNIIDNTQVAGSTNAVITVTAPSRDVSVAVGQAVQVSWEIQNLPASPLVDILYRVSTEAETANKVLISDLNTSNVGSCQIDTFSFVPGLSYIITVQLKASEQTVTAEAPGRIYVTSPSFSVTSPKVDTALLPSEIVTIDWTGAYLPAGGGLETFIDFDKRYDSGNEVVLKSSPLPASGASQSGSVTLPASDMWKNSKVSREHSYYVGLRVVKNGQTYIAAYAPATIKLYNGQGFNITSPAAATDVRIGEKLYVKWSNAGVPSQLRVHLVLIDHALGTEFPAPDSYTADSGSAALETLNLIPNHQYELVLKLQEGDTVLATRTGAGLIRATAEGSSIYITNEDLKDPTKKAYVGLGNTYDVSWQTVQPPLDAKVRLFLDEDGDPNTTTNQVEITPSTGVDASLKHFLFSLTVEDFASRTGRDYVILVKLYSRGILFAQNASAGKLRIGEGGVYFTQPTTDVTKTLGDPVTVKWQVTGDICTRFPTAVKKLRLYVDQTPAYHAGQSQEITDPNDPNAIDPCQTSEFTFDSSVLKDNKTYYIVGRLFLENNEEEESWSVSAGKIIIPAVQMKVVSPSSNVTNFLGSINVTWEISGIVTANRKVKVLATPDGTAEYTISPDFDASIGSGLADASKLPPGTYTVRCLLFEINSEGEEIRYLTGDAVGQIIVPNGYAGTYDLADMSLAVERNYSPIDGCVFTGFNIGDRVGYEVAGIGKVHDGVHSDVMIFSQFGQESTVGNAGAAYVIYGRDKFPFTVDLSTMCIRTGKPPVDGSILLFPMENLPFVDPNTGYTSGRYYATGIPDISGDSKGDVIITCLDAAPLSFTYTNNTASEVKVNDHYGIERTIPADESNTEPSHVYPHFWVTGPQGSGRITHHLDFSRAESDSTYLPGDHIHVTVNAGPATIVTVDHTRAQRGAVYMITSNRLAEYNNAIYDLNKLGSPSEEGSGLGNTALCEMMTWRTPNHGFGASVSPMCDLNSDQYPEMLISAPKAQFIDTQDPNALMRIECGVVKLIGTHYRETDIAWPYQPMGTMSWVAQNLDFNSDPSSTDSDDLHVDIVGAQSGSQLGGAAGLGTFSDTASFGGAYVKGDFNGDLISDFVLGAPGENSDLGTIYIVPVRSIWGRRLPTIDLADFNVETPVGSDPGLQVPILGIKITGTIPNARIGENLRPAGDFNGDGLADFMFSLPNVDSSGKSQAGRLYIVFGKKNLLGDFTLDDVSSEKGAQIPGLIFEGQNAGDHFGTRIACVYDVNGDTADDILVSAPDADAPGKNNCGKVYVIYGVPESQRKIIKKDLVTNMTFVDYDGNGQPDDIWSAQRIGQTGWLPGAVFLGEAADVHLQAIAPAGDVNNDGLGDFLVGSPDSDVTSLQKKAGKAYLILGRKFDLPTP